MSLHMLLHMFLHVGTMCNASAYVSSCWNYVQSCGDNVDIGKVVFRYGEPYVAADCRSGGTLSRRQGKGTVSLQNESDCAASVHWRCKMFCSISYTRNLCHLNKGQILCYHLKTMYLKIEQTWTYIWAYIFHASHIMIAIIFNLISTLW